MSVALPRSLEVRAPGGDLSTSAGQEVPSAGIVGPYTGNITPATPRLESGPILWGGINSFAIYPTISAGLSMDLDIVPLDPFTLQPFLDLAIGDNFRINLGGGFGPTTTYVTFGFNTNVIESLAFGMACHLSLTDSSGLSGTASFYVVGVSAITPRP